MSSSHPKGGQCHWEDRRGWVSMKLSVTTFYQLQLFTCKLLFIFSVFSETMLGNVIRSRGWLIYFKNILSSSDASLSLIFSSAMSNGRVASSDIHRFKQGAAYTRNLPSKRTTYTIIFSQSVQMTGIPYQTHRPPECSSTVLLLTKHSFQSSHRYLKVREIFSSPTSNILPIRNHITAVNEMSRSGTTGCPHETR